MNKLDLRLDYKADTGYLPIHREEFSLQTLDFDFSFEYNIDPKNEDACEITNEVEETLQNAERWAEDILDYIEWLESNLIEKTETIRLIQKYKLLK